MNKRSFEERLLAGPEDALDFLENILEASTERSIIGTDVQGKIVLWNQGARRSYGYEREEAIGKMNATALHTREDVLAGKPQEIGKEARREGKWEGVLPRRRKDGSTFSSRMVVTPRRDSHGETIGYLLISKDITDEVGLAEQLESIQHYTRSLVESNIDALIVTDPLGVITDVNQQMCEMTGRTREQLIGTPFKDYVTDPAAAEKGIRLALLEGKVTNYALTARAADGRETDVSYNAKTFNDRGGKPGVFASARDVTAFTRLAEQLESIQLYTRSLVESNIDALIVTDPLGVISDVNQQMCEMTGRTREQLIGTPFKDYVTDPAAAEKGIRLALSEGKVTNYALTARATDGRETDVSYNAKTFNDRGGKPGVFASARDVTAFTRLAEQLELTQLYTRSLVESNIDALIVTDPLGVITDVNQQMCEMTGRTREQLIGCPFKDCVTDPAAAENGIRLALLNGKVTNSELTARATDGRETVVSYNAKTFNLRGGKLQGVFATARDLTEHKRLERELAEARVHQTQRLESLGSLAGGIAHDFNNLLSVIVNYSGFVFDGLAEDSPMRQDVEQIQRAANRAASLTHQLLIFGRREVVKPQVLELNVVVTEMEKMLRRTIGEQIELKATFSPDLWRVKADPSQVEQVLTNLVVNARDAMPSGGLLTIETGNTILDEADVRDLPDVKSGRYVCLAVSDTGAGMDAETMRRAFEPFFTTKPKGKGTGLGLATVYGIAKLAGGHVGLSSVPNKGTVVRVYLPASDEMMLKENRATDEGSLDGQQQTILLVEDEDAIRELSRRILSRHGYHVIDAPGPLQALERYDRHAESIDLVLTDVVMPQMNGKALVERMRQRRPDIKVLYMSGYPEDMIANQGKLAEGIDLLEKPFDEERLLRAVRRGLLKGVEAASATGIEADAATAA